MNHELYIKRCLELALAGNGMVDPNPMVGALLVHEGRIVAEGWHQQYGGPHAEVNAIKQITDPEVLKACTLYVNLEPCSHTGKTPPCADLVIESGIKRVYISNMDPNPLVAGRGIEKLRAAGVEVITSICEAEGKKLNSKFFTFYEKKRPYTLLKWAETTDGFIAPQIEDPEFQTKKQISNKLSRRLVHRWRAENMAILVGTNTAFYDNPLLNVRFWTGRNPLRVVWDPQMRLPHWLNIFNGKQPTLVIVDAYFSGNSQYKMEGVEIAYINFSKNPARETLEILYQQGITSLMVEGGSQVLQTFINEKCWDESRVIRAPHWLGNGIRSPKLKMTPQSSEPIGDNTIWHYENLF